MSHLNQQSTIDPRKPRCRLCDTMTSIYWRVPARNLLLCNNCFLHDLNDSKNSNQFCKLKRIDTNIEDLPTFENRFHFSSQNLKDEQLPSSSSSSTSSSTITKSKRSKIIEPIKSQIPIKISTRQQPTFRSNRKTLAFKSKKPEKCSSQSTTFNLFDVLYSKGRRFEIGDIVYLIDSNLSCFYAQIRALFQDEHVNAFAFLTWLLPTSIQSSTNNFHFDPNAYSIGPNEEYPRSLNSLSFVCHAPSDYFQVKTYPQSITTDNQRSFNYIWTPVYDDNNNNNNNENDYSSTLTTTKRRPLSSEAKNSIDRAILHDSLHIQPFECLYILYNKDVQLTQIIILVYADMVDEHSKIEFAHFNYHTSDDILARLVTLTANNCVIFVQSQQFRLDEYRLRLKLFQRNIKNIEHVHLNIIKPEEYKNYVESLAFFTC